MKTTSGTLSRILRKLIVSLAGLLLAASASAAIPTSERDALLAVYQNMGGASWTERGGWNGAAGTECDWFRVECDEQRSTVIGLYLYDNNLTGSIPNVIGNLRGLRRLYFFDNNIGGTIPVEIGQLANLEELYLDRNPISGAIPVSFGSLSKLRVLAIQGTQVSGAIPTELGNLSSLESFLLQGNALTGQIPRQLGQLTNLVELDVAGNQLTGPIPPELGALNKLEMLQLSLNSLSGTIPPQLGNLTALKWMRLSYNQLTGSIPAELRSLRNLEELDFYFNSLSGPLPRDITQLPNLRILSLGHNALEGQLPPELWTMPSLVELYLGENKFIGELPSAVGGLTNLEVLGLALNNFTGQIPDSVTTLSKLRSFELMGNAFEGPLPRDLGRLTNLVYFDVASNKLSGTIPTSVGSLTKLQFFSMYENQISGPIPSEFGQLPDLRLMYLTSNRLTGPLPESLRNIKTLEVLYVAGNQLTGPVPVWLGELTALKEFYAQGNLFTGTIPSSIGNLTELNQFDVQDNRLTGFLPNELANLKKLIHLNVAYNALIGPIPAGIWELPELQGLWITDTELTGTIPRTVGTLKNLVYLGIQNNNLEGTIPSEIGALSNLEYLNLWGNRFTGPIPPEIGNLTKVYTYDLSNNALIGAIPPEITRLTSVNDAGADLTYNRLFTTDPAVRQFVNRKQWNNDFEETQTITPTNVRLVSTTDRSAVLEWTPIRYTYDDGGYQVVASTSPGGPAAAVATTSSKEQSTITVRNLSPTTTYHFTVATVTHPHYYQQNLLVSPPSPSVSGTTGERVLAPPEVELTENTRGLIVIDGTPRNEDRFTVTNFGDMPTTLTVVEDNDFANVEPETFTLAGGASQTVIVKSVPRPPGQYWGGAFITGPGTGDGIFVGFVLLSVARPAGTVRAEAVDSRVEVAGAPGSDSVGQARFRNVGTAQLSGVVLSDQPWVVPRPEPITIDPGQTGAVNFTVIRSRRPEGAEGALVANLSLIYVDGTPPSAGYFISADPPPGTSVTKVTVVDVSKPATTASTIPAFAPGEVAYFLPGLSAFQRSETSFVSDLSLLNNSSGRAMNDLRLYYTPAGAQQTTVASLGSVPATQSVTLANVVTRVYGAPSEVGSLQIRTDNWQNLILQAKLLALTEGGTFAGDMPIFRSDRAIAAGQQTYLAGVRKSATLRTDLYVQETAGAAATVRIEFFDASGAAIGTARTESVTPFGMIELLDAVPSGGATVAVTNQTGSLGRISTYARVSDTSSGETWSIVDWSRFQPFRLGDAMRVPYVDGLTQTQPPSGGGGKRRAVPHATTLPGRTDVTLFNPSTAEVRATVQVVDAGGTASQSEVTIAPRETITLTNVGANVRTATGQVVITPYRAGQLVVTARSSRSNATGSGVPVVSTGNGLRVGQSQIFSNLSDSTGATVAAAAPGTYRTSFGLVETSGAAATVRARIFLDEGRALATSAIYRDFQVGAGQQIVVDELVRAIVGASRDSALGDLHSLQLRVEVLSGSGSVVPFVIITDNATGDSLLRLE